MVNFSNATDENVLHIVEENGSHQKNIKSQLFFPLVFGKVLTSARCLLLPVPPLPPGEICPTEHCSHIRKMRRRVETITDVSLDSQGKFLQKHTDRKEKYDMF